VDCAIIVDNRPPSGVTLSLSGTSIEYGQGVVVTGSAGDADDNLSGQYLWRTAPGDTPDHSVAAAWLGKTVSGSGAVITGTLMPSGTGAWQIHTNSVDASGAWGPGASATLAVAGVTPVSTYDGMPLYLTAYTGAAAAIFSASFFNPHNAALPVPGTVVYRLVTDGTAGAPLTSGTVFSPGSYIVRAGIPASANYNQAQADATLTVTIDPDADDNGNQVKDWIEHTLGLGVSGSNHAGEDLEINIHTPIN
jgi:hypothetical protein